MQKSKLQILQKFRLRPERKGRLPNFTKDFEAYTDRINKVIKNKVQWSFQFNKFGIEKIRKLSNLNSFKNQRPRQYQTQFQNLNSSVSNILQDSCSRLLKYNETIISPDHKIKTRQKSSKKHNKRTQNQQKYTNVIKSKIKKINCNSSRLPEIDLTARSMGNKKQRAQKQNYISLQSQNNTIRFHCIEGGNKNKSYNKMLHIVTMGRKELEDSSNKKIRIY